MTRLTRDAILARKIGQEEVDLGDGSSVLIRGLSRGEALDMNELETVAERDRFLIRTCLVDPVLSAEDVDAWFSNETTGVLDRVAHAAARLSGMDQGQGKDATKSVPRGRGRRRA